MKNLSFFAVMMCICLATGLTAKASPIHQDALENNSLDLIIPLSPSKIEAEVQGEQTQRDRANQPQTTIEIGFSSWMPTQLETPSRISNPSAYSGTGVPAVNINLLNPLSSSFNFKLGMGLLLTHRFANLDAIGENQRIEETASIVSARLGLEYLPAKISTPVFRPYLTASILPTMILTNRTALDSGNNYYGLPVELGAGSLIAFTKTFGLNLGVTDIMGLVNHSKISGLGANAMLRMPL